MSRNPSTPTPLADFYDIPLIGEVKIHQDWHQGDYNLGELIQNFRKNETQRITLIATDNSLSHSGIFEGDYLTVDLTLPLKNNDIAAVKLGNRVYIRRIFREKALIRLETDAPNPNPIIIDPQLPDFALIGKVIAIIREF